MSPLLDFRMAEIVESMAEAELMGCEQCQVSSFPAQVKQTNRLHSYSFYFMALTIEIPSR
jgi:hypothetical protein